MGFRRKFNIRRYKEGSIDANGNWIKSTKYSIVQIKASIQPLNNNDVQVLPEGTRVTRVVKIYTSTKLLTTRQAYTDIDGNSVGPQAADILIYENTAWEIIMCNPFQSGVINHYKCYAQEVTGDN